MKSIEKWRWLAVAVAAALLAGGCDSTRDAPLDELAAERRAHEALVYDPVTVRGKVAAKSSLPPVIPADAHLHGVWSSVIDWPLIAVHVVLLPDGRVLSYGSDGSGAPTGYFNYDLWTPSMGYAADAHLLLPNVTLTDLFCGSQVVLPQPGAGVFLAGGDNWTGTEVAYTGNNNTNVFSYGANTLTRGTNLNRARWYSTATVLLNGETYIQGGKGGGGDFPEVRGLDGSFRLLTGAATGGLDVYYPRNFIAPGGRVFGYDSVGRMYYVDPTGNGSVSTAGQFASAYRGDDGSAAMFRPGRILQLGGKSSGALVIDITGTSPVVSPTQSLSSQRRLVNATILADGQVLATGGSSTWNQLVDVNTAAEIWNPASGTWTRGAPGALARLYHSSALLLPDATVLVAGGGAWGPLNNLNAEIYHPPYLFTAAGALAPRPRIVTAPTALQVGRSFAVDFADAAGISRVVLVKNGSVTHSFNMEQRFVELSFSAVGSRLSVQMSAAASDTPPGYYMLFLLDDRGVPSPARIVWINVANASDLPHAPVVSNPGDRHTLVREPVSIALQASDADGDALAWSATGLPPGLSITPDTGLISGTPQEAGTYHAVVSASDSALSGAVSFVWTVSVPGPLQIAPMPASNPAPTGVEASYTVSANGNGTRFRWNFGNGSPETPYSPAGSVTHRFAAPGLHFVTVTATDDSGAQAQQTFLQIVHRPLGARAPTASSGIAYEARAGLGARLWVVNEDNDSVSVFDAGGGARLAEIAIGASPRSVAIDAAGRAWVTNKRAKSISVIDPATLQVIRTISLARASQPHGIAMSPAGDYAYVVLEATGQVLKYRTATYSKLATVAVGTHPRHVSVSADGSKVFVSRFITPPQPGESTALVGTAGGGEIVRLNASNLAPLGTTVLGFGSRGDTESQGRGVPNYLGPMVISPDGTQARVPSKQDNIQRGTLRDGLALNFQNTVRAISSRVDPTTGLEDAGARIDHDNAGVASAAAFDPLGVLLFVALETSREVAVVDAHGGAERFRFAVGRAPRSLAVSPDGGTLYVANFMDRSLGLYDLRPLRDRGEPRVQEIATVASVATEKLATSVLLGKQLFHDARDTRLAADGYMSCASCHEDGGEDGRVWDLTGFGEGLRNTIALRGRAGSQGFLHWSNNFDEVQDFEGQIRALAGGSGLMSDEAFFAGTRAQPLGAAKAGLSADLDALAAYVSSLSTFDESPLRVSTTALTAGALAGRTSFANRGCGGCHGGSAYTGSGANTVIDVGTQRPESGLRLGGPLTGIDVPTLRDVWSTAPYLHDGSAPTVEAAIRAHQGSAIPDAELADLAAFVKSIGKEEAAPAVASAGGTGLRGDYFNNKMLAAPSVLTRNEAVDFSWSASPGTGVDADGFSVRWSGKVVAPMTGGYQFQTSSNDAVRLWVDGVLRLDQWNAHTTATHTTLAIPLLAGHAYAIVMEHYDNTGTAVAKLRWQAPGTTAFVAVPVDRLLPP